MNTTHQKLNKQAFAKTKNNDRYKIIDVRSVQEHASGSETPHCLPVTEINAQRISDFVREHQLRPDQTLVLLCASGKRAEQAAHALTPLLPNPIAIVEGGLSALNASGSHGISIERQVRIAAGLLVVLACLGALLIHSAFIGLAFFVGCGLLFAGISNWCGMGMLLLKMPWNR